MPENLNEDGEKALVQVALALGLMQDLDHVQRLAEAFVAAAVAESEARLFDRPQTKALAQALLIPA